MRTGLEYHMYLVHIKDEAWDFYALFRVESLTQRSNCVISWSLIQSPEQTNVRRSRSCRGCSERS